MNKKGLSAMQDAILFVLMVSISGMILLPAFTHDVIKKSYIEREKDELASEALIVLLATTKDEFSYEILGNKIKEAFGAVSPNPIESDSFGDKILKVLLERKEYHKSYGELIAECLACQFLIPIENSQLRINILTEEFEEKLKVELAKQLKTILGERYVFNLTIKWNPIIGLPFGGEISVGEKPPLQNVYVAKTWITMPFRPEIDGIILSANYLRQKIDSVLEEWGIPTEMPTNEEEWKEYEEKLAKNIEEFLLEIFFKDENSVANISLKLIFNEIEDFVQDMIEKIEESGDPVTDSMGKVIEKLFTMLIDEISKAIKYKIDGNTLQEKIQNAIRTTCNYLMDLVEEVFKPIFSEFAHNIAEKIVEMIKVQGTIIQNIKQIIYDYTINRIAITRAEAILMIWGV